MKKCSFEGCRRNHIAKGYCTGHYQQVSLGKPLTALIVSRPRRYDILDEHGNIECQRCRSRKSSEHFTKKTKSSTGHQLECKECQWARHIEKSYNISLAQYNEMLARQNGACSVCATMPEDKRLSVDHDHSCCPERSKSCGKCVRSLLCTRCNVVLGAVEDDTELLKKLIEYLN